MRTTALLRYLADPALRARVTAATNKADAYNGFSAWLRFGNHGVIAENDPAEQEKSVKFNGSVALMDDGLGQGGPVRRRSARVPAPRSSFVGFRFPPDVIMLAVRWYLRYGLSYRDVEELLNERGIEVDRSSLVHTLRGDQYGCDLGRRAGQTVGGSAELGRQCRRPRSGAAMLIRIRVLNKQLTGAGLTDQPRS